MREKKMGDENLIWEKKVMPRVKFKNENYRETANNN